MKTVVMCALALAGLASVVTPTVAGAGPETPKVERVRPLSPDPLRAAPGVFFCEDLETITDLKGRFNDLGLNDGRFGLTADDPFSGEKSIQQTYIPLTEIPEGADPGNAGWVWRFFGDNPNGRVENPGKYETVVARWYHKFEEGFTPRDGTHFPPKMARMGVFRPGDWSGAYRVYFWIGGEDGHISIERRTRAPGAHREWLPNYECQWRFSDPVNVGRWIHFELRVALGKGKRADQIQAWADGILVCDVVGDDLAAGYREYTLNGMQWDCYWNGGSPVKQSRFYDDLMLATEPIGPARTGLNPVIVLSEAPVEAKAGAFEVEVAEASQKPLVVAHTVDEVVTRHQVPEFEYTVVWKGSAAEGSKELEVSSENGEFVGPRAGQDGLRPNALHMVRVRQEGPSGTWSEWSRWHAGFATTWAEATPPEERTPPKGYLLGHARK